MSVFETGGSKGPGFITRLAIKLPKSATLWKWMLLLLTLFCPFFLAFGPSLVWWGIAFAFSGGASSVGWFIVFSFGNQTGGPVYLIFYLLWLPVLIGLLRFNKMVKNRVRSRLAGILTWYYFIITIVMYLLFIVMSDPYVSYGIGIPTGLFAWFVMYLRYKQLNYYLDLEVPRSDIAQASALTPSMATTEIPVKVTSGYDIAGENLKLAVKISNEGALAILNVTVNLDTPDGFEYTSGTLPSQKIGNINAGTFQSAIFWLKPQRCVDDEYGGSVVFRDPHNKSHTIEIPRKRIVNVCPMLLGTDDVDSVFKKLKFGSLARNCASFKFTGSAKTVYELAKSRLRGLDPVDRSEQTLTDGNFLGYACFIGQTKFGDQHFAAEVQTTGTESAGVLTLSVYSDDERILSGFMIDVMQDVREHVTVIEEQACPLATCPKCGADIDPTRIDENRVYICNYCGGASKAAPWLA
ncbi:hypothetical protein EU528_04630 [Candidatus Thorarchaeota archaeon]|nr:MAG: hypothetical protein EU528_04630 [Candidatus Thorarchaeota archaeon]